MITSSRKFPLPTAASDKAGETLPAVDDSWVSPDPLIAQAAFSLRRTPTLYSQKTGLIGRRLYAEMLTHKVRLKVDLPWFVTAESLVHPSQWPNRKSITAYWKELFDEGYRSSMVSAPSQGDFGEWVLNRLRTPQSGYTLEALPLFPSQGCLFYKSVVAYTAFHRLIKPSQDDLNDGLSETTVINNKGLESYIFEGYEVPDLEVAEKNQWLMDHHADELTAWVMVMLAHHPSESIALQILKLLTPESMGPMTRAGLQYFIDCCDVVYDAYALRQAGVKKIPDVYRKALPAPAEWLAAQSSSGKLEVASPPLPKPARQVPTPEKMRDALAQADNAQDAHLDETSGATLVELAALLVPGEGGFDSVYERMLAQMQRLQLSHQQHKAEQQEQARLKIDWQIERAGKLLESTETLVAKIPLDVHSPVCSTKALKSALQAAGQRGDAVWIDDMQGKLEQLTLAYEDAFAALSRVEEVSDGKAPELTNLVGIDATRRKSALLQASFETFDAKQKDLKVHLGICLLLPAEPGPPDGSSVTTSTDTGSINPSLAPLPSLSAPGVASAASLCDTPAIAALSTLTATATTPAPLPASLLAPVSLAKVKTKGKGKSSVPAEPVKNIADEDTQASVSITMTRTSVLPVAVPVIVPEPEDALAMASPEPLAVQGVAVQAAQTLAAPLAMDSVVEITEIVEPSVTAEFTAASVDCEDEESPDWPLHVLPDEPAPVAVPEQAAVPCGPDLDLAPLLEVVAATVHSHHWALSSVGVQALEQLDCKGLAPVNTIAWGAMLAVLSGVSSRSNFDARLTPQLQEWLSSNASTEAGSGKSGSSWIDAVGIVGASLLAMLFEDHQGAGRWAVLDHVRPRLNSHRPMAQLTDCIASLDDTMLVINRETLSAARVGVRQAITTELHRQRARAADWSNDAELYTNWPSNAYQALHTAMFDDKHGMVLGKFMAAVSRGSDDLARKLLPEIFKYTEKMSGTLGDLRKSIGRRKAVEGPPRDHLVVNLEASVAFARNFFDLLDRSSRGSDSELPRNLVQFLDTLYKALHGARDYLQGLEVSDAAQGIHRDLTVQILSAVVRMMDNEPHPSSLSSDEQLLLLPLAMGADYQPSFTVPLEGEGDEEATPAKLVDPAAVFDEIKKLDASLTAQQVTSDSKQLLDMLEHAAHKHRENGRLLPARAIEAYLPRAALSTAHTVTDVAQRGQRADLQAALSDARQRVTNAMSLGALAEGFASRMLKVIEALSRANGAQEIGRASGSASAFADYPHAFALLAHHVLSPLDLCIDESRVRLEHDLNVFAQDPQHADLTPEAQAQMTEKIRRIRDMIQDGSVSGIRVAHNAFVLLREGNLPLLNLRVATGAQDYCAFQADLKKLTDGHRPMDRLMEVLQTPCAGPTSPWISALNAPARAEAAAFIKNWLALCAARQVGEMDTPLSAFFLAIGVSEAPTPMQNAGNAGRLAFYLPNQTFIGSDRSGPASFIPPCLGSAARHIQGFVVKHHPSSEALGQLVAESAQATPTFVLARASLSLEKRAIISRDHPVILMDDDLVAYLALNPEQRVGKLMEVGLLTFQNNPYDDYGGPVPSEMFFGRKAELRRLREVKNGAVLYGGRRLGKSSLLDRIQQDSRKRLAMSGVHRQGEMAIYIPLDTRMDSAAFGDDYRLFAWKAIYKALVTAKFIQPSRSDLGTNEAIRDYIGAEVVAGRAATNACYLLIDEADEVMREDLKSDALFITGLQTLCDQLRSVCHMRYVIAGLHNLTRMTTGGNSVLGKAESIALQPFSSDIDILNGIDLVTRPLNALGFYFPQGSENLPLRIMALCNFYPAFMQLYCKNLITRLYNKRGDAAPPTLVEPSDLDAVERDEEFLTEIQGKFDLNLDLDKRYKAIALIMADVYYTQSRQGMPLSLSVTEVRDYCQSYAPEHFRQTGPGSYEALLEEMEKLTVLECQGNRYQLRTPHIATMMGTHDRVVHLLEELAREKPTESRIPGESRLVIRSGHQEKVFPMTSAWVRGVLRGTESRLIVMVGNQLSGLSAIDKLRGEWGLGQDAAYEVKMFSGHENAKTYLMRARRLVADAPSRRMVAMVPRSWRMDEVPDYAQLAKALGRAPSDAAQPRVATMRLALIASPEQSWALAQEVHGPHAALVQKDLRIEPVPCWNDDAVYYRIEQSQNLSVRDNTDARQAVLDATCGFGEETERLCSAGLMLDTVAQVAQASGRALGADLPTFYTKIGMPHGITAEQLHEAEQLLLLIDGERRADEAVHETIQVSGVPAALFTFFQWMGLVQLKSDGLWQVPSLYKKLIA